MTGTTTTKPMIGKFTLGFIAAGAVGFAAAPVAAADTTPPPPPLSAAGLCHCNIPELSAAGLLNGGKEFKNPPLSAKGIYTLLFAPRTR
jgi:hypothetical protein